MSDVKGSIQHTKDRPFNDRRYAVDGSKLRHLGWQQRVSFEDGLTNTVDWYGKFPTWWGSIDDILSPFPEMKKEEADVEEAGTRPKSSQRTLQAGVGAERKGFVDAGCANGKAYGVVHGLGKKRKADALDDE